MTDAELDESPPSDSRKVEMNTHIGQYGPGDTIRVLTSDRKARTLTVERCVRVYDGTPEWTGECIDPDADNVLVCSGYGTTYLLHGYADDERADWIPALKWPSQKLGTCVWDVSLESGGEQIIAEQTAGDLLGALR